MYLYVDIDSEEVHQKILFALAWELYYISYNFTSFNCGFLYSIHAL